MHPECKKLANSKLFNKYLLVNHLESKKKNRKTQHRMAQPYYSPMRQQICTCKGVNR